VCWDGQQSLGPATHQLSKLVWEELLLHIFSVMFNSQVFFLPNSIFLRTEFCYQQAAASSVTLAPVTTKARLPPPRRSYIRKSTGCQMVLYFPLQFLTLWGKKRNLSITGQKTLSPLLSISRTFYSISKDTLAPPPVFTLILTISVQK